jgi:hypothetical protein
MKKIVRITLIVVSSALLNSESSYALGHLSWKTYTDYDAKSIFKLQQKLSDSAQRCYMSWKQQQTKIALGRLGVGVSIWGVSALFARAAVTRSNSFAVTACAGLATLSFITSLYKVAQAAEFNGYTCHRNYLEEAIKKDKESSYSDIFLTTAQISSMLVTFFD